MLSHRLRSSEFEEIPIQWRWIFVIAWLTFWLSWLVSPNVVEGVVLLSIEVTLWTS